MRPREESRRHRRQEEDGPGKEEWMEELWKKIVQVWESKLGELTARMKERIQAEKNWESEAEALEYEVILKKWNIRPTARQAMSSEAGIPVLNKRSRERKRDETYTEALPDYQERSRNEGGMLLGTGTSVYEGGASICEEMREEETGPKWRHNQATRRYRN